MSDNLMDSSQVISGIAILLSFFAGYKYGLRNPTDGTKPEKCTKTPEKASVRNQ